LAYPIQQRHWLDADPGLLGRGLPAVGERMKKLAAEDQANTAKN
jgi:hypothetical protein